MTVSDLLHKVVGDVANERNNFSVEVVRDTARTVGRNQSAAICPVLGACIKKCSMDPAYVLQHMVYLCMVYFSADHLH